MPQEKRRYFRINETLGLSVERLGQGDSAPSERIPGVLELMSEQDERIEKLLLEVEDESPKVAALIMAFNQKLERVVSQLVMDNQLVDKIANKIKEVNISACGMAFVSDTEIELGARLGIELELSPEECIVQTKGEIIACEALEEGYFWRVDFFDMSQKDQETLIQHIVRRQSVQLGVSRSPKLSL